MENSKLISIVVASRILISIIVSFFIMLTWGIIGILLKFSLILLIVPVIMFFIWIVLGVIILRNFVLVLKSQSTNLIKINKNKKKISNEKILASIYGIMHSKIRYNLPYFGISKSSNPENALIFTNLRMLFITIPIIGAGYSINGEDFNYLNICFNKKEIIKKGRQIVLNLTPQEIMEMDPNNFSIKYSDIKNVKINDFWDRGFKIIKKDNAEFKYSLSSKNDLMQIKEILKKYSSK